MPGAVTNVPLLITSAVLPVAPFVAMDRVEDRLRHVLDAVKSWRLANPELDMVICDGSGYDLEESIRAKLGTACRGIEVMCFVNNQEVVRENGKGYGEGEILLHALHYSRTLRNSCHFAKCTGKLFVRNYGPLASSLPDAISVEKYYKGRYSLSYDSCDTRFYIANRDFYLQYLSSCHESVNDHQGRYIEQVFADGLKRSGARFTDFKVKPLIEGYSGTKNLPLNTEPESRKRGLYRLVRRLASSFVPVTRS
jgi:hypothetical protein